MSKIGRVVFNIMERYEGNIPQGYTLEDYFKEFKNDEASKTEKTHKESTAESDNEQQIQQGHDV